MLSLAEYRAAPCRAASLPYWKTGQTRIPEHMRIVHDSEFTAALLERYTDEPYFRLKHDLDGLANAKLPAGFAVREASCQEYAEHIRGCYSGIGVSEEELQRYTQRRVYRPELWLAVCDASSRRIVATGIAELDDRVSEGILEWIQVSGPYRGRGIGKFLVLELLHRMRPAVDFATVSGKRGDPACPEQLYRKCGFSGGDVWHVLSEKR